MVKNLHANTGDVTDSNSLGPEDPLEEEMATHSTILAWRILGKRNYRQRSLMGYSPWGLKET